MVHVGVLDRSRPSRVTVRLDEQPNSRGEARRPDVIVADPADRSARQALLIEQSHVLVLQFPEDSSPA
jgi:hypothetical protein